MLTVKNLCLTKQRRRQPLLHQISMEFPKGSITLLLGPSGAGKSSLLRCLAQLETGYEGQILFDSKSVKELSPVSRARCLSFIAQSYALFPHLNALQNCSQPLEVVYGKSPQDAMQQALHAMASLRMHEYVSSYPSELSGGQQQRIAIARALALKPSVLLLDEPSSALDPTNTEQLANILISLAGEGKTLVIATQDMSLASQLPARIYQMEGGRSEFCK